MDDAGQEVAVCPHEPPDRSEQVERVNEAYLADADGDARLALRQAVADGVEAAALVSHGFARWGWLDRKAVR